MTNLAGWQATLQDDTGAVISGGSVEVLSTAAGTPSATLFSDAAGTSSLSNPFNVGVDGFAQFFVATGQYTIAATAGGQTTTWTVDLVASSDVAITFDDVSSMIADTGFAQPAGTIFRAGPFRYEVAASGATDQHLTTDSGAKLYALPDADGRVYVTQLGATAGDDIGTVLRTFVAARQTGISYIVQDANFEFSGATVALPSTIRGYVASNYADLAHGEASTVTLAMRDREAVVAAAEGLATETSAVMDVPAFCLIGGIRFDHSVAANPAEMRNGGSFNVLAAVQDAEAPRVNKCAFVQEGGVCMSLNGNPNWKVTDCYYDTARTGVSVDTKSEHGMMDGCYGTIGLETLNAAGTDTQKYGDWIKTNRGTINGPKYCTVRNNYMVNSVRDGIDGTGGLRGWLIEGNTFDCDITGIDIKQDYSSAGDEEARERYFQGITIRNNTFIGCGIVWTLSWVDANMGFAYDERLGMQGNICEGNVYWPKHGKNVTAHFAKGVGRVVSSNESLRSIWGFKIDDWDASTGSFPSGSTARNYYEVTTGGTVDGETFTTGDIVYALVDDASTTAYAGNWVNNGDKVHSGVTLVDVDDSAVFPQEALELWTFTNTSWDVRGANSGIIDIPRSRFNFADLTVPDDQSVQVRVADVTIEGYATKLAGTATNPVISTATGASNLTINLDATHEGTTANMPLVTVGNQTLDRLSVSGRVRDFDQLVNVNSNATLSSLHLGAIRPLVLSGVDGILVSNGTPDVTEVQVGIIDPGTAAATLGVPSGNGPTVVSGAVFPQKRGPGAELTIASGVVAVTHQSHTIDTEGDAASDDLDTINGGAVGDTLTISAANDARTVVAKNGTGNLTLGGDRSLDEVGDTLVLRKYADGNWHQVDFFSVT